MQEREERGRESLITIEYCALIKPSGYIMHYNTISASPDSVSVLLAPESGEELLSVEPVKS